MVVAKKHLIKLMGSSDFAFIGGFVNDSIKDLRGVRVMMFSSGTFSNGETVTLGIYGNKQKGSGVGKLTLDMGDLGASGEKIFWLGFDFETMNLATDKKYYLGVSTQYGPTASKFISLVYDTNDPYYSTPTGNVKNTPIRFEVYSNGK